MAFDLGSSLAEVERQVAPIATRHQLDDDIGVLAHAVDHLAWCVRALAERIEAVGGSDQSSSAHSPRF